MAKNAKIIRHEKAAKYMRTSDGNRKTLTDDEVVVARKMLVGFKTKHEIAAHFGVHQQTLDAALRRG